MLQAPGLHAAPPAPAVCPCPAEAGGCGHSWLGRGGSCHDQRAPKAPSRSVFISRGTWAGLGHPRAPARPWAGGCGVPEAKPVTSPLQPGHGLCAASSTQALDFATSKNLPPWVLCDKLRVSPFAREQLWANLGWASAILKCAWGIPACACCCSSAAFSACAAASPKLKSEAKSGVHKAHLL